MASANLPRVFCSFNDPWLPPDEFDLRFPLSLDDLNAMGDELRDGVRVVLYEPGELEVEGTLRLNAENGRWIGTADWKTVVHSY